MQTHLTRGDLYCAINFDNGSGAGDGGDDDDILFRVFCSFD